MKNSFEVEMVVLSEDPGKLFVVVRTRPSNEPIPNAAIVGAAMLGEAGPDWRTFVPNPAFVEIVRAYLSGQTGSAPEALRQRVEPGEHFFVVDGRCSTREGDAPPEDIIGAYETDATGKPIASTFRLSPNHRLVDEQGRLSSLFDDEALLRALEALAR
jgi:hypothetical protein